MFALFRMACDCMACDKLPDGAEGGTAGAAPEAGQHRSPGNQDQDGGQDPSWEVPAQAGGQVEGHVVGEVRRDRVAWHEPHTGRDARGEERPEPQVHDEAVQQARHQAVSGQHHPLGAPTGCWQAAGAEADPTGGDHLERGPGADPAGQEGADEHGESAEHETDSTPEHPARHDQQEEHRLEPGGPGPEHPQRPAGGSEHSEHRDRLGVHAAAGQLGHDQCGQQRDEQHEKPRCVRAVRQTRSRLRQEGPQEGGQPDQGGRRQGGRSPPSDGKDRLARGPCALCSYVAHEASSAAATSATVSQGCGCITFAT